MNLLEVKLALSKNGFSLSEDELTLHRLNIGIKNIFFNCMICQAEKDISNADTEEKPLVVCKRCGQGIKVDKLYEKHKKGIL